MNYSLAKKKAQAIAGMCWQKDGDNVCTERCNKILGDHCCAFCPEYSTNGCKKMSLAFCEKLVENSHSFGGRRSNVKGTS